MRQTSAADYHAARAKCELDLGLTVQSTPVARAHLKLASLHMTKLQEPSGKAPTPPLPILG